MDDEKKNLLTSHDADFRKNRLENRIKEIKNELENGNSLSIDFCTGVVSNGGRFCTIENNLVVIHYAIITGFRNFVFQQMYLMMYFFEGLFLILFEILNLLLNISVILVYCNKCPHDLTDKSGLHQMKVSLFISKAYASWRR